MKVSLCKQPNDNRVSYLLKCWLPTHPVKELPVNVFTVEIKAKLNEVLCCYIGTLNLETAKHIYLNINPQ